MIKEATEIKNKIEQDKVRSCESLTESEQELICDLLTDSLEATNGFSPEEKVQRMSDNSEAGNRLLSTLFRKSETAFHDFDTNFINIDRALYSINEEMAEAVAFRKGVLEKLSVQDEKIDRHGEKIDIVFDKLDVLTNNINTAFVGMAVKGEKETASAQASTKGGVVIGFIERNIVALVTLILGLCLIFGLFPPLADKVFATINKDNVSAITNYVKDSIPE